MDLPTRDELIAKLTSETFDLVVIGGGATGAGVALDATLRGLKVALVEKDDFGSGTSSRSTKLLHGGVRYLENAIRHLKFGEFQFVKDALRERRTLFSIAAGEAKMLRLLTPLYSYFDIPYYWTGLKLYDKIAGKARLGPSHFVSKDRALEIYPHLRQQGLKGGIVYLDGQFDDARMNLALIISAIKRGCVCLNYLKADKITPDGVVCGKTLVKAKRIVNATGPDADQFRKGHPLIHPSRGVHIVIDKEYSAKGCGVLIPKTQDGRLLFVLPWKGATIVGTTDDKCKANTPLKPLKSECDFLLDHFNKTFDLTLTSRDIKSAWVGVRPLADPTSRDHTIDIDVNGVITICGGKWTTYRLMAKDVVDLLTEEVCTTDKTPLEPIYSLPSDEPLYAMTPIDVLARRSRIAFTDQKKAVEMAPELAHKMSPTKDAAAVMLDKTLTFLSTMAP